MKEEISIDGFYKRKVIQQKGGRTELKGIEKTYFMKSCQEAETPIIMMIIVSEYYKNF